jgi:F-type H+-transporting ATPase subunit gamma
MSKRRTVERHARGLAEIGEILGAMKNLAVIETARLRKGAQAQATMAQTVRDALADFLGHFASAAEQPPRRGAVYVLVGSERGFCGGYNEAVLAAYAKAVAAEVGETRLVAIGQRLTSRLGALRERAIVLAGPSVADQIPQMIEALADALASEQVAPSLATASALVVVHHDRNRGAIVEQPLAALAPAAPHAVAPVLQLPPEDVFAGLLHQHLLAALHRVFYEALLAENEQRLQHLDSAMRSIDRKLNELRVRRQALRQEEITEEIEVILLSVRQEGLARVSHIATAE